MDFSKFSASNFDAKDWINDAFKSAEPDKEREQYSQSLVMKLQLFIQEMNKSLEDTSQQIVQSMPRTIRELESMQQEALLLHKRMKSVEQEVQKVEQDTVSAMDSLLKIDTVKARVHHVENALREIDNWTLLRQDIDEVFSSGDAQLMADRLASMQKCLRVLGTKVADYKERNDLVDQLKDQFVAATSPSVVAAFTSQSVANVQYFAKLFKDIDRTADLEQYYEKCLRTEEFQTDMQRKWTDLVQNEALDVSQLLSSLHDALLTCWFSQLQWASQAFANAPTVVCAALSNNLKQLEPGVEIVIGDKLDSCGDKLAVLTTLRQNCDSVATSLSANENFADCQGLVDAVYAPLLNFAMNYQQYQTSDLLQRVNIWSFDSSDFEENVRRLEKAVPVVFTDARQSAEKCVSFIGEVGLPLLAKSLQTYLSNFLSKLKKLHHAATLLENGEKNTFSDENWDFVDSALKIVHIAGKMQTELNQLEECLYPIYCKLRSENTVNGSSVEERRKSLTNNWSNFEEILTQQPRLKLALEGLLIRHSSEDEDDQKFLPDIEKQILKFTNRSIRIASEMILGPITALLETLPKMTVWSAANVGDSLADNLPMFSLAPQEYITKVGQYLVTFAHHLEPYMSLDDSGMTVSLLRASLPHIGQQTPRASESGHQVVQWWLRSAGAGLMARYAEISLRIRELSHSGAQQLATDIEYLCNVVEDLGLCPSDDLNSLKTLLVMDKTALKSVAGYPAPLLAAVKEIRKVK